MAEHIRFRHFVVCTHCYGPIPLVQRELEHPPKYVTCTECGHAEPFIPADAREYTPDA
jgi:hypothetical protein